MINEQEQVKVYIGYVDNIENDVVNIRCYAGHMDYRVIAVDKDDLKGYSDDTKYVLVGFRYKNSKMLSCYYVMENNNDEDSDFMSYCLSLYGG